MIIRSVNKFIRELGDEWSVRKSKNHYFLYRGNRRIACVGGLSQKNQHFNEEHTLTYLRKHVARETMQ